MRKILKKCMSLLLAMLLVLPILGGSDYFSIGAEAKTLQTKEYQYSVKDGKVTIEKYIGSKTKVTIPSKIAGKKVTAIGENAFSSSKVEAVTVPSGVTKIGANAFIHCENLKKVVLPSKMSEIGNEAFGNCTNLTKVTMPKQLTKLGTGVFERCSKLKEITLPKGIAKVPAYTFLGCTSLKKVVLPKTVSKVETGAFNDCEKLETIGDVTLDGVSAGAFVGCKKLSSQITLSEKCKAVGSRAFYGCEQVKVTIPETVINIGEYAFAFCKQITSIVIPDNFKNIGTDSSSATLPAGSYYEQIQCRFNMNAYAGCTGVTEVVVSDTNPKLVEENGVVYNKEKTDVLYVVPNYSDSMDFLENVERIGYFAFTGSNLQEIVIPDNITEIKSGVFYGAQTKAVSWSKNAVKIPSEAFKYSAITKLAIPEGVTSLGEDAIDNCDKLTSISLPTSFAEYSTWVESSSIFYHLPALEKVTVADGNSKFYAKNGILFEKGEEADTLLCYPASKKGASYTVPKNVKLGTYCFDSLKYLKKVTLQNGGAEDAVFNYFVNCTGVSIVIPKTVVNFPSVGHAVDFPLFTNCTNCKALVYKNSKAHKYFKKVKDSEGFAYKVISK